MEEGIEVSIFDEYSSSFIHGSKSNILSSGVQRRHDVIIQTPEVLSPCPAPSSMA